MSVDNSNPQPAPASKGREVRVTLILIAVLVAGALYVRSRGGSEKELTIEERYQADPRLAALLYDCPFGRTFDADSSDLIPMMVSKLERGARAPLRAFIQELAAIGAPAIPELERTFNDCYGDPNLSGVLTNILTTCAIMDAPEGLDLGTLGLEHPRTTVRLAAVNVIAKHGDEHHYDAVKGWLPSATTAKEQGKLLQALQHLDPSRFHTEFVEMLEQGAYREAWLRVAPTLATVEQPDIIQKYWALALSLEFAGEVVPYLAAPAAKDGEDDALRFLRERLKADRVTRVQFTLEALRIVGLGREAAPVLLEDDRPQLRALAAKILAEGTMDEEVRAWLRQGLSDPDSNVRDACMVGLVRAGDKLAESQALALMTGNSIELSRAVKALNSNSVDSTAAATAAETASLIGDLEGDSLEPVGGQLTWVGSVDLAQRAYDVLTAEFAQSPDRTTQLELLKAIGRIPSAASAEFLLDAAAGLGPFVGNLTSIRWCAGQAFNTGPEGHAVLRAHLPETTDPIARLDLIEFIWQDHSEASRELLMDLLAKPETSSYEKLYIADRLTQMRAATKVAPRIKQAYLASTHRYVRPALQCLLWQWFGQHNS